MRYIGIDPGLSGGIAYVDEDGTAAAWPMPPTHKEILDLLDWLSENETLICVAMLERVGATPQMGVVSAFTFGKGYGALQMALAARHIPYDQVAPVKWQNVMECRTPKDRRAELGHKDKNINKRRAENLFPRLKVTHATADALLLASYARRIDRGLLPPIGEEPTHGKEKGHPKKGKAAQEKGRRKKASAKSSGAKAASEAGASPGDGDREGHRAGPNLFPDR